jgi:hypothetical protein
MGSLRRFLHRNDDEAERVHAGLAVRSNVALHHADLDRDLAAGVAPQSTPEHSVRLRQLLGRHVRRGLAGCIDSILARAEHPPHWHSTALPIQTAAVVAARGELEGLRDALLSDAGCSCRGVAQASVLLHDEGSPVYTAFADVTVADAATAARAAGCRRRRFASRRVTMRAPPRRCARRAAAAGARRRRRTAA